MDYDFWDTLLKAASMSSQAGSIDSYLTGKPLEGEAFNSVRQLTDKYRTLGGLELPIPAGTRVAFKGSIGSVMSYADPPAPKAMGTVVAVRTATGHVTDHQGSVFVEWDDGKMRPIHASHLTLSKGVRKEGSPSTRIRVASLGDLTDFMKVAESTLVHKSTKDLWALRQDGSDYVIERLFDDQGKPLKV